MSPGQWILRKQQRVWKYHRNMPIQDRAKCIYHLLKFLIWVRLGLYRLDGGEDEQQQL